MTKSDCRTDCAWFGKNGECCMASLPDLVEKLEDVDVSVESLEQTIHNKEF